MNFKLFIIFLLFGCLLIHAQQTAYVDFQTAKVEINEININGTIEGKVKYEFRILADVDSIYLDARDLKIYQLNLDERLVNFEHAGRYLVLRETFRANSTHDLMIHWSAEPKKAMYFIPKDINGNEQIWTQGQGKYTSHWLPSIDDMNDRIEFDVSVIYNEDYQVIANGKLIQKDTLDSAFRWHYNMDIDMSSYLVALAIGKYDKQTIYSNRGVPIELYYYPGDDEKVEPTYRYTKKIFDFLEREIGMAYPWQNYKQIPVHDFLYAGMENTSATIFSDRYVVDSTAFKDDNFVNINAHELAHQWFGDMVTETSGTHHWLHEGFATYYALLAEQEIFGHDHFYWKLFETAQQLEEQDRANQSTALLDPGSNSLTFYQKGAWTLFMLREKIGDRAFRKAIINYLKAHAFGNVETSDFIEQAEMSSEQDLSDFVEVWLESDDFPYERAIDALKHNSMFISEYLMVNCDVENSKCNRYLDSEISDKAKIKVIQQDPGLINKESFNNSWEVRQAIAIFLKDIPIQLKANYESLLSDDSYITIENALFNLWTNFPEDRMKYLSQTKGLDGFANKNVKLLWLLLASATPEFGQESNEEFKSALVAYTDPKYNFEIRITAFSYLRLLKACDAQCVDNLELASNHHNWQMVKFAKQLLTELND